MYTPTKEELESMGFKPEWEEFFGDFEEDETVLQVWTFEKNDMTIVYCARFINKFLFSLDKGYTYEDMRIIRPTSKHDIETLILLFQPSSSLTHN